METWRDMAGFVGFHSSVRESFEQRAGTRALERITLNRLWRPKRKAGRGPEKPFAVALVCLRMGTAEDWGQDQEVKQHCWLMDWCGGEG